MFSDDEMEEMRQRRSEQRYDDNAYKRLEQRVKALEDQLSEFKTFDLMADTVYVLNEQTLGYIESEIFNILCSTQAHASDTTSDIMRAIRELLG